MPTTQAAVNFTGLVHAIQARTNSASTGVDDLTGPDLRLAHAHYATGGALTANAFKSAQGGGMSVNIGSGTAGKDAAVVRGIATGSQLPYVVGLNATTVNVTLNAASATVTRTDELYLVVFDPQTGSGGTLAIPQLIVRTGDAGGANPGPDGGASWKNYLLIGRYTIPQNATTPTITYGSTGPDAATFYAPLLRLADADTVDGYHAYAFPRVLDIGNTLLGGTPSGTTQLLHQFGSEVVTTDAGGGFSIFFPTPFPNGLARVLLTPGDNNVSIGMITNIQANHTLARAYGLARNNVGTAIDSGTVRIEFDAIGW
jgi:hypothetical protein